MKILAIAGKHKGIKMYQGVNVTKETIKATIDFISNKAVGFDEFVKLNALSYLAEQNLSASCEDEVTAQILYKNIEDAFEVIENDQIHFLMIDYEDERENKLLRLKVENVFNSEDFKRIILNDFNANTKLEFFFTHESVELFRENIEAIKISENLIEKLVKINGFISQKANFTQSKWLKAIKLLKTSALANGRDSIDESDLKFLGYMVDFDISDEAHKIIDSVIFNDLSKSKPEMNATMSAKSQFDSLYSSSLNILNYMVSIIDRKSFLTTRSKLSALEESIENTLQVVSNIIKDIDTNISVLSKIENNLFLSNIARNEDALTYRGKCQDFVDEWKIKSNIINRWLKANQTIEAYQKNMSVNKAIS